MSTQLQLPRPNGKLASEQVVLSSPMSYSGMTRRIWPMASVANRIPAPRPEQHVALRVSIQVFRVAAKLAMIGFAATLLMLALIAVTGWYAVAYTLFFIPTLIWRFFRRGQRKDKRQALQHRELLDSIEAGRR